LVAVARGRRREGQMDAERLRSTVFKELANVKKLDGRIDR